MKQEPQARTEQRDDGQAPKKQELLRQILALRDAIESERGVLPDSSTLVRDDRER
jgi:hypothetical protein